MHKFKPLAAIAFKNWTQDQCVWIIENSKYEDIAAKVAKYVLKKKYNQNENQNERQTTVSEASSYLKQLQTHSTDSLITS